LHQDLAYGDFDRMRATSPGARQDSLDRFFRQKFINGQ